MAENMSEMVERVAALIATSRGCDDPESAKSKSGGEMPCPFCLWDIEAEEESGCVTWARKMIAAMREPAEAQILAADHVMSKLRPDCANSADVLVEANRIMIDEALR